MESSKNICMMDIRKASHADADTIVSFNKALAWETEHYTLNHEKISNGVRAVIEHPEYGFYLVGTVMNTIVGSCMITYEWSDWRNGLFWWIESVYVLPSHRNQGVFRTLYTFIKTIARQHSEVCGLRLYVERENSGAQKTYQALGMHETAYKLYEELLAQPH